MGKKGIFSSNTRLMILYFLIYAGCISLLYYMFIFIPLQNWSQPASFLLPIIGLTVSFPTGYLLYGQNNSLGQFLLYVFAMPFGLYTSVSYYQVMKNLITSSLVAAAITAGAFSLIILGRKIRGNNKKEILHRRVRNCTKILFLIWSCQLLFVTSANLIVRTYRIHSDFQPTTFALKSQLQYYMNKKNNRALYKTFSPDVWGTLSDQEKTDALEQLLQIESEILNLPKDTHLYITPMEENCLGSYNPQEKQISINKELLNAGKVSDIQYTLYHEIWHAAEYHILDHPEYQFFYDYTGISKRFSLYRHEMDSYVSGTDEKSYYVYIRQQLEIDSNWYAEQEMSNFLALQGEIYPLSP